MDAIFIYSFLFMEKVTVIVNKLQINYQLLKATIQTEKMQIAYNVQLRYFDLTHGCHYYI